MIQREIFTFYGKLKQVNASIRHGRYENHRMFISKMITVKRFMCLCSMLALSCLFVIYVSNFNETTSNQTKHCEVEVTPWAGLVYIEPSFARQPLGGQYSTASFLIYVYSRVFNFKERNELRKAFVQSFKRDESSAIVFVIGLPSDSTNKSQIEDINKEENEHNDILQISVRDTYFGLGYKGLFTFNWLHSCCHKLKLIAKIDDDNVMILRRLALKKKALLFASPSLIKHAILCVVLNKKIPVTAKRLKPQWESTREQYNESHFPAYCNGNNGVFFTPRSAARLTEAARNTKIFHLDDIYIFGLLRQKACMDIARLQPLLDYGFKKKYI